MPREAMSQGDLLSQALTSSHLPLCSLVCSYTVPDQPPPFLKDFARAVPTARDAPRPVQLMPSFILGLYDNVTFSR